MPLQEEQAEKLSDALVGLYGVFTTHFTVSYGPLRSFMRAFSILQATYKALVKGDIFFSLNVWKQKGPY
jgi:hypothetical protein